MSRAKDCDSDSDLDDPDVEELELLRKALGNQYTAVSPSSRCSTDYRCFIWRQELAKKTTQGLMGAARNLFSALSQFGVHDGYDEADVEDEADDDGEADEEGIQDAPQDECPGLVPERLNADAGASPQHDSMENTDAQPPVESGGEEEGEQDVDEEDEEDDEEWEPAPTRTELLQDAVQYLQQASAEHEEQDAAAATQEEEPVQVRQSCYLLGLHVSLMLMCRIRELISFQVA